MIQNKSRRGNISIIGIACWVRTRYQVYSQHWMEKPLQKEVIPAVSEVIAVLRDSIDESSNDWIVRLNSKAAAKPLYLAR